MQTVRLYTGRPTTHSTRIECLCDAAVYEAPPEFWIEVLSRPALQDLEGTELVSSNGSLDMQLALEGLMALFTGHFL